jgi:hypothetical protein
MVIGYYDGMGLGHLIPGDASTQTDEVNQAIASEGGAGSPRHYEDYSLPLDNEDTGIRPDRSEAPAGDEHADDCIADFMFASQSVIDNYYGWAYGSHVDDAFVSYIQSVYPDYAPVVVEYAMSDGSLTWDVVTDEIDAGHPMVFLVDTDGDDSTDHFITVIGYAEYIVEEFACYDTWAPADSLRWCEFLPMMEGRPWGVYKGWNLNPDETYVVGSSGGAHYPDIQDALDEASRGARILVEPGVYTGPRNRDLDFGGKPLRLYSIAGPESTFIDCEGLGRGFNFHSQEEADCVIDGFTIRNGSASEGAGVRCFWDSSPTLRNLVIGDCTATGDGGGVWAGAGSAPSLTNVTVTGCSATFGGAVRCDAAAPVLQSVTLHGNAAANGGGISCDASSTPTVRQTIISGSASGAAVHCERASNPSITHCCVYGNAGGDSLCGDHFDNMFASPRFCGPAAGDLTLRDDSPCLPQNNEWQELIGAQGAGECATGLAEGPGRNHTPLALGPATPNPSARATSVAFDLTEAQEVTARIFDAAGRLVRTLAEGVPLPAGQHRLHWGGTDDRGMPVGSGVYFVHLTASGLSASNKIVILR